MKRSTTFHRFLLTRWYLISLIISVFAFFLTAACRGPEPPTSTTSESAAFVEIISEVIPEPSTIEEQVVSQPNCGGVSEIENNFSKTHAVQHTIQVGGGYEVSADGTLGVGGTGVSMGSTIATQLNYAYGSETVETKGVVVKAAPGTHMEHIIRTQEIWQVGNARITLTDKEIIVPFKFRTGFTVEVGGSRDLGCPAGQMPVPSNTPYFLATNTPIPLPTIVVRTLTPSPVQATAITQGANPQPPIVGGGNPPPNVPPTAMPSSVVAPTASSPTTLPPTAVPPTAVPPTAVPPTLVTFTAVPPTAVPPTAVPPTTVPPTTELPTAEPPTEAPPFNGTGIELLSSTWRLQAPKEAAEAYQEIDPYVLVGRDTLRLTYNLFGLCALPGDASAIVFDQFPENWHYISLSNYGSNCKDGVQTIDIPLTDFGLDLTAEVGQYFHTRFWAHNAYVVEIYSAVVYRR